jgi:hypothetical protein
MRVILCLMLMLPGCASTAIRCERHLQPINPPAGAAAAPARSVP